MKLILSFFILMNVYVLLKAKSIDLRLKDARINAMRDPEVTKFKGRLMELDEATDEHIRSRRSARRGNRWTDAVIPYVIDNSFSSAERIKIEQAMAEMEMETCLDFVKRQSSHRNYLKIISADGCWSYVGMNGGEQELSLYRNGCIYRGTIIHELMHAAGVNHQHKRPDRDEYVTILLNNVKERHRHNFKKAENSLTYGIPYQYRSVMHYGRRAFSSNGQDVIKTKDPSYMDIIGNAETFAKEDIQLLNKMYNCDATVQLKSIGCYKDSPHRALSYFLQLPLARNTPKACVAACKAKGYPYAGLQYSEQCFCGDWYDRHGMVAESECNMPCSGDGSKICGGSWRNSIYATGKVLAKLDYVGCYNDDSDRAISYFLQPQLAGNTRRACVAACGALGFTYAGLQYSTQCFCGDSYGRHGIAPEAECNMKCSGDDTKICGGTWRNSVYSTGKFFVKPNYVGCYKDSPHRALSYFLQPQLEENTPKACIATCSAKGYPYAGLQYSEECFCGDWYDRHDMVAESECNTQCSGDGSKICGGTWRNSIYATGKVSAKLNYVGCYKDEPDRALSYFLQPPLTSNTRTACITACGSKGYPYAGLQYSEQCFCGDWYDRYGMVAESECDMPCSGDNTKICGGSWRNSIYATGRGTSAASAPSSNMNATDDRRDWMDDGWW